MLDAAYKSAIKFTKSHYENFPVISFFIPKKLRKHVAVVYQFARQADDIADEGDFTGAERMEKLNDYRENFNSSLSGKYETPFLHALHNTIREKNLNTEYFLKLLDAFESDILKKRYKNFAEVLEYCSNSANPVGRIILELFGVFDEEANEYSDAICTALQLTNFYQDAKIDYQEKGRVYVPEDELQIFFLDAAVFSLNETNEQLKTLLKYQVHRTRTYFEKGKKLFPKLPHNLKRQIVLTVKGGETILDKIEKNNFDVLSNRPTLTKIDYFKLLLNLLRY